MFAQKQMSIKHKPSSLRGDVSDESEFQLVELKPKETEVKSERKSPLATSASNQTLMLREQPSRLQGLSRGAGGVSLPPVINASQVVSGRYRFTSLSNALVSVSIADVLGACGGVCSVTNSVFKPWASSFRIKEIRMYPGVNPNVGVSYNSVAWNSGISGVAQDQERVDDLPAGITVTHALSFKPPEKSLASDWISCIATTTTNLFAMQSQVGTIIDFHVDYTLSNQFQAGSITIATGTLGSIYYLPLDGAASAEYPNTHLPGTH
jgi:hypothetical protein